VKNRFSYFLTEPKRVIGDTMKSRHDDRRATEAAIAVEVINQMNEFRCPNLFEWHDRSRLDVQTRLAKAPCNKVLLGVELFQEVHAKVRPDGAAGRSTRLFKTPGSFVMGMSGKPSKRVCAAIKVTTAPMFVKAF